MNGFTGFKIGSRFAVGPGEGVTVFEVDGVGVIVGVRVGVGVAVALAEAEALGVAVALADAEALGVVVALAEPDAPPSGHVGIPVANQVSVGYEPFARVQVEDDQPAPV